MREAGQREKIKVQDSKFFLIVIVAFFIFHFALTTVVFGAEEAAHGAAWKGWLWKIVNFAVLVIILFKFLNKPLREFLRKRTELIEKSLQEAQEAKALAEKALAEVEERLKLKDQEIAEIIAFAQRSGKTEQDLLVQSGEQVRERIIDQARNNIDYELRQAKESLKAEAAGIALELAEKKIREKLTKEQQIKLIEESLARMEEKK